MERGTRLRENTMPLTHHRYGKGRVRTLRLARDGTRHEVRELTMQVMLEGDFSGAFTDGDNRSSIATDTMKNIVNVLAHRYPRAGNEDFAGHVAAFFLDTYPQVTTASVTALETRWTRLVLDGTPHDHGFTLDGNGQPLARVVATRDGVSVESGIENFTFMKTTESGWSDFHADEYRTLPDTDDRIAATSMDATWRWNGAPADYEAANARVMTTILGVFVGTYSRSIQDSMYRMGEAALAAVPELGQIRFAMPNKHYIPVNLTAFGITDNRTVLLPTDEPHGQIEAVIGRG
jgi:urate oxidase